MAKTYELNLPFTGHLEPQSLPMSSCEEGVLDHASSRLVEQPQLTAPWPYSLSRC